jgi:branched-chain amino acid transport system permease protein
MIIELNDTLIELWLLNTLLAFSAYIVLTGGAYSFAYVAFIAVGGYAAGILTVKEGADLWVALLVAPAISVVVALLIARPLERLSGIYLAIVSVSLVGIVQVLLINLTDLTGGALGLAGVPLVLETWHLALGVVLVILVLRQVERSNLGRAIRMTRLDPLVAGAMGVNVRRVRLWLFVSSALIGSMAGVLRSHYFGFVTPADYGFNLVILLLAMVIIGGVGHWAGPVIGAAIFTLLPEWLREFGEWRDVVTGALLLFIIVVSREGIAGAIRIQWHKHRSKLPWSRRETAAVAAARAGGERPAEESGALQGGRPEAR